MHLSPLETCYGFQLPIFAHQEVEVRIPAAQRFVHHIRGTCTHTNTRDNRNLESIPVPPTNPWYGFLPNPLNFTPFAGNSHQQHHLPTLPLPQGVVAILHSVPLLPAETSCYVTFASPATRPPPPRFVDGGPSTLSTASRIPVHEAKDSSTWWTGRATGLRNITGNPSGTSWTNPSSPTSTTDIPIIQAHPDRSQALSGRHPFHSHPPVLLSSP